MTLKNFQRIFKTKSKNGAFNYKSFTIYLVITSRLVTYHLQIIHRVAIVDCYIIYICATVSLQDISSLFGFCWRFGTYSTRWIWKLFIREFAESTVDTAPPKRNAGEGAENGAPIKTATGGRPTTARHAKRKAEGNADGRKPTAWGRMPTDAVAL